MTELGFLIDLLLNHKLPLSTKTAITTRLKAVEEELQSRPKQMSSMSINGIPTPISPIVAAQAPSMQAIMARNPDLIAPSAPVAVVAQTPAAMAAMASREQAISESMMGKTNKETGRPRKF